MSDRNAGRVLGETRRLGLNPDGDVSPYLLGGGLVWGSHALSWGIERKGESISFFSSEAFGTRLLHILWKKNGGWR